MALMHGGRVFAQCAGDIIVGFTLRMQEAAAPKAESAYPRAAE